MTNYLGSGDPITVPAPSGGVVSGLVYLLGTLIAVAASTAAEGVLVAFKTTGEFRVPKAASQAWTVGAKVYWDDTNKVFTTSASGNTLAGVAVEAVGSGAGETIGKVRLDGVTR